MFNLRSFRDVVLFVFLGMFCVVGSVYAAGSSDELLGLIPADSLVAVRLNNFDLTLGKLDSYISGLSPMPLSLSMMAKVQIGGLLGDPGLTGINFGGNFGAYLVAKPGQMEPEVKVLVPVSDYGEFVSGNPNVGEADASGISKLTMNGAVIAVVKQAGNYAVFGKAGEALSVDVGTGLGSSIDADEKTISAGQPIWAYVNLQKVGEVYGEVVVAQLEKGKTMMADASASMEVMLAGLEAQKAGLDVSDPNQLEIAENLDKQIASTKETIKQLESNPMMDNMGNIMDVYIRVIETLFKESKSFSFAIKPEADVLTVLETYTAMPGSGLASALAADTSGVKADKLINYLQDGAMLNFVCRLNKPLLQRYYSDSLGLMDTMFAGKMSDEEVAKMKGLATDAINSLGGAMALSVWADETASPPFMEDCIIEVSDVAKFNQTVLKGTELWKDSGMVDFYKEMGMEMSFVTKMNVYEYKGAKVNSAMLKFTSTNPDSQEAEMIKKMYGDGFEYRWAIADGLFVEAIAGDVDAAIKQLIDEVKAGGSVDAASDIKQAVAMLGDGADDFFGTFNIIRMLKMVSAIPSVPMPTITVESKSNIAFGGKIGNGKAVFKVAVPKAHISEVMSVFMPKPAAQ